MQLTTFSSQGHSPHHAASPGLPYSRFSAHKRRSSSERAHGIGVPYESITDRIYISLGPLSSGSHYNGSLASESLVLNVQFLPFPPIQLKTLDHGALGPFPTPDNYVVVQLDSTIVANTSKDISVVLAPNREFNTFPCPMMSPPRFFACHLWRESLPNHT